MKNGTIYSLWFKKYIGKKEGKYLKISGKGVHDIIWMVATKSEIPKNENGKPYEVHHIDFNPLNNSIHNLVLLSPTEHRKLHNLGSKLSEETKNKISEKIKGENNGAYGKPSWNKGIPMREESKQKLMKKVLQIDLKTNEILNTFNSIKDAMIFLNVKNNGISNSCKTNKPYKGYIWKYLEEG